MKTNILIVEDEAVIAADLMSILTRKGYEVTGMANTEEEALASIAERIPDLVFMDIVLDEGQDGIEAAMAINQRYDVPIVFLTAHADEHTIRRAAVTAPHGYLLKPFDENAITITIEMALAKHRLERRISQSETRYRTLFEKMVNAYALHQIELDDKGAISGFRVMEMNEVFKEMLAKAGASAGAYPNELFGEGGAPWTELFGRAALQGETLRLECYSGALGKWYSAIIFSPGIMEFALILADITELKIADEKLRKSNEELRNLASYIETVREEERAGIARDMHDYLGQSLTALRFDLSWCLKKIPGEQEDIVQKTRGMLDIVDRTIQTVRTLCAELRPGVLDDLGLAAAIEWHAGEVSKSTGLAFNLRLPDDELGMNDRQLVNYFRIFQELVTNIIRHSGATAIEVSLGARDGELVLSVADNGSGIDEGKLTSSLSLGIMGMRERARSCGGELTIGSVPGSGTRAELRTPLGK